MSVRLNLEDDTLTARLSGDLDHHTVRGIREEIDAAANRSRPAQMVLDFKGVTFMDSSGIGLVMGRWTLMRDLGGVLYVENMPVHIQKVMRIAGLANIGIGGVRK